MSAAPGLQWPSWIFKRSAMPTLLGPEFFGCLVGRLCIGDAALFMDDTRMPSGLFQIRVRRGRFVVTDGLGGTIGMFGMLIDALDYGWSTVDAKAAEVAIVQAWLDGTGPCPWPVGV